MEPIFSLQSIGKNYEKIRALEDINLTVETRDTVGLVGYSGAGKTTLLRILAGLEYPSTGKLIFQGQGINEKITGHLRKKVTMLFQNPIFLFGNVFSNVAYGLRIRGLPENQIKEKVADALAKVKLDGFGGRNARKLSGGEQQRVALARALVLNPLVLLLDEPTSNLDPANAAVLTEVIREESKKCCVIVATHNFAQVRRLTKWTIYIENGYIVEKGSTDDLFRKPQDPRTARFINGEF